MHSSLYTHVRFSVKPFAKPFAKAFAMAFAKALAEALQRIAATIRYAPLPLRCATAVPERVAEHFPGMISGNELWKYIYYIIYMILNDNIYYIYYTVQDFIIYIILYNTNEERARKTPHHKR